MSDAYCDHILRGIARYFAEMYPREFVIFIICPRSLDLSSGGWGIR